MADSLWEHPDWAQQKDGDNDDGRGLEYTDLDAINNWVVQFRFNRVNDPEDYCGNGSFLNVPSFPDKHIIITCAHNLIHGGKRSINLEIHYNNPFEIDPADPTKVIFTDPKRPAIIVVPIENNQDNVYICKDYTGAGTGDPAVDYGVIVIPRTSIQTPHGFGFSLKLAFRNSFKGNVHVSGFRKSPKGVMKPLRPLTSSGVGMSYHNGKSIEYRARTESGISGSPVWVQYNKFIAVVGIQYVVYSTSLHC